MIKYIFPILIASCFLLGSANAASIDYTATNLTDINLGEDLWEYSYSVSDHTFIADTGFTVYFDHTLYNFIDSSPVSPNGEWDVITWNPDSSIPADGAYDAFALVDNASLIDTFTISFVWLGGISGPGSQLFEIYNGITWDILDNGLTEETPSISAVPIPTTFILFGTGLAGILSSARKKTIIKEEK